MDSVWTVCGQCMESVWTVDGQYMGSVWTVFAQCMDSIWTVYGKCMDRVWTVSGPCMESVRRVYGKCMESVWTEASVRKGLRGLASREERVGKRKEGVPIECVEEVLVRDKKAHIKALVCAPELV